MRKLFTILFIVLAIPAFSVNITFKVSMKGSGKDLSNGVYIVGTVNAWSFEALANEGDSLYSITKELTAGDTLVYYYITTNTWTDYMNFREPKIPNECGDSTIVGWSGDRLIIVPASATNVAKIWGSCADPGTVTLISNNQSGNADIIIYPNPSNGIFYVDVSSFKSVVSVEVLDISGKILKRIDNVTLKTEVNLEGMPSNLYFIRISDGVNTVFQKTFIK